MATKAPNSEIADIVLSIGNIYSLLGCFNEAVSSYHEALIAFKLTREDNNPSTALVFTCLANVFSKTGKLMDSEFFYENELMLCLVGRNGWNGMKLIFMLFHYKFSSG